MFKNVIETLTTGTDGIAKETQNIKENITIKMARKPQKIGHQSTQKISSLITSAISLML